MSSRGSSINIFLKNIFLLNKEVDLHFYNKLLQVLKLRNIKTIQCRISRMKVEAITNMVF